MAWDLTVMLENRPGALADLGDAVGRAEVNLGGGCAVATGTRLVFGVDDLERARVALV